jgi:hypothetical protein
MSPSDSLQEEEYKEKSKTMMMIKNVLFPSSIYMRSKGDRQYICGPMPLQATYNNICRFTHVERYTPRVHMSSSKVMSSKNKAPNARALHEVCPMLLLQACKDSNKPPKPCTPLGSLLLLEHYCNPSIPKSTPSLHASIQATPCYLGPNSLIQDAKISSFHVGCSPSK